MRNSNLIVLLVALSALSISVSAQKRRRPVPQRPVPQAPVPAKAARATLNLQAGLVYQATGPEMLARATFSLLDDDLSNILHNAGIEPKPDSPSIQFVKRMVELGNMTEKDLKGHILMELLWSTPPDKLADALRPHIKASVTTDFHGVAQFVDISPGSYYVFGYVQTHSKYGHAAWNMITELKPGENQVILDQNNMVPGSS